MTPDSELLARFARNRAEDAFAELVGRHVNLVYSAALRQVGGDAHLAQDVAQTVFTDLARKAAALKDRVTLTGWLYTSARFAAAKIVRAEHRRHDREEKFMRELPEPAPEPDWDQLRPVLDEAMHQLKESDREAILLRYFENRSYAEIGALCGLNENAARMRVERAVEKMRLLLAKRGVATVAAVASVISVHAVQAAPANLAGALAAASVACSGAGTFMFWNVMRMTRLKLGFGAVVIAVASTTLIVEHQATQKLSGSNEYLTQQIAQTKSDNEALSRLDAEARQLTTVSNDQFNEILRLRGEAGMLRQSINGHAGLRRVNQKFHAQIEAQSEATNQLSDEDLFTLRQTHAVDAMNILLKAVQNYAASHNGHEPTAFDQLTASGNLNVSNLPAGVGVNDFEFLEGGWVDPTGRKFILGQRVPILRPGLQSVMIYGGISDAGFCYTSAMNVYPDEVQNSSAKP